MLIYKPFISSFLFRIRNLRAMASSNSNEGSSSDARWRYYEHYKRVNAKPNAPLRALLFDICMTFWTVSVSTRIASALSHAHARAHVDLVAEPAQHVQRGGRPRALRRRTGHGWHAAAVALSAPAPWSATVCWTHGMPVFCRCASYLCCSRYVAAICVADAHDTARVERSDEISRGRNGARRVRSR